MRGDGARTGATRGQTTLDFAIGVGVFLLVVAFVVAFVPTIFEPFERTDRGTQVADRLATSLSTDLLGDPGSPYVLDDRCTRAFFEQLDTGVDAPPECRYNTTAETTSEVFALGDRTGVNVTVEELDGGIATSAVTGRRFAAGPPVPDGRSITAARRVVRVEDEPYRLVVRVW
jgi:hypothetical protein